MIIGSHVSFNSEQLLGSVKEALSYDANTFMFYTGAPQNTIRKNIDDNLTKEALKLMETNHIDVNNVICHAPYIINLANNLNPEKWEFSINFLKQEITRCEQMHIKYIVLHPGSAVGLSKEIALQNIIDALNIIINEKQTCQILLETMAGKGTECASNLEELSYIIKNVKGPIGVCLDTCHLNDSGVDIANFEDYLKDFDNLIGLDKIHCLHLNDSKNLLGSHKDRHANIGYGTIGFANLLNVINNPKLKDVPKILETPYVGNNPDDKTRLYPPYKFEIAMLKNQKFNDKLINQIIDYYK